MSGQTFLRPVKRDTQPKRIFGVWVSSMRTEPEKDREEYRLTAMEWAVCEMVRNGNTHCDIRTHKGDQRNSLWDLLAAKAASGGLSWVFLFHAVEQLPLSGFFRKLESGDLSLSGEDRREESDSKDSSNRRGNGFVVLENPPTIVKVSTRRGNGVLQIVDLKNYGIESLTDLLGADHWPAWFGHGVAESREARVSEASRIATAVAETANEIIRFLDENELGELKTTASSQAMASFRRRFLRSPIYLHRDSRALDLERSAYFGGRCESPWIGRLDRQVYHYDFVSQYPSCCIGNPLPIRLVEYRENVALDELPVLLFRHMVIAEVSIVTDEPAYPLRLSGGTVYPTGKFRTFLCGPELINAFNHGRIKRVHRMALYDGDDALSDYMKTLFECRILCQKRHGKGVTKLVKRMLNGLPGKFAQAGKKWIDVEDRVPQFPYGEWYDCNNTGERIRHRAIAWNVQKEVTIGENPTSCPAIGAWVTSLARIILWRTIQTVGRERVYYYDTDSLHVDRVGSDRLIQAGMVNPSMPGYLRLVEVAESAHYYSRKHYRIGDRTVYAGVSKAPYLNHDGGQTYLVSASLSGQIVEGSRPVARKQSVTLQQARDGNCDHVSRDGFVPTLKVWREECS